MATNIAEALQGAGAISAKPVTMEAIPEATIDVGGGSQSLEIEGLGVKRRKDDLSVATASTSQLAVEDLFGDLLDEVNFSDPSSVDAFREAAAGRINEFDSNTFSNILGEASTVAGDLATLTSQFQDGPQPQRQFEQVFGPPSVTSTFEDSGSSFDTGFDSGLDTATSTEAQDISDLTNPGLAAGLVGGAFGTLSPGASFSGLASDLALQAIGQADVVGAFGGFNSVTNALNAEINDLPSAINATATALSVGQQAANVADLVNSNVTITDLFDKAVNNVEEFVGGIVSAVSNPEQAIEAFGMDIAYGTQTPDVYNFSFPGGTMSFAFDAKTGAIAVPEMVSAIVGRSPLSAFYDLSQFSLDKFGYTDAMADRNLSAIDAFSMPGVEFGPMSIHTGPQGAMTGIDPETGAASSVGAFSAVDMSQQGFGMVGFDLGAVASSVGTGTIGDLSFTDFQNAAISGHLGHGPLGFDAYDEEEALAADIAGAFSDAGLETAADLAAAIDQAGIAAEAFASSYQSFTGVDLTAAAKAGVGQFGGRAAALAASAAAEARSNPEAAQMSMIDALDPAAQLMTEEEIYNQALAEMETAAANAAQFAASYDPGGYNSNNPDALSIDIAERTMEITNTNMMDPNNKEQQEVAKNVALGIAREREAIGIYGDEAFGQPGFSIDKNYGYEDLTDEDISGDAGKGGGKDGTGKGGSIDPGYGYETDGGDSDSDSGDTTYICTAAYANGVTDYSTFSANRKYGVWLRRNDPYLMKGYDLVGPTLANVFGGTKVAKILTNYYKMDLDKKVVSFRYKLLQIFLKGVMRPAVRTIGYLDERIFK